MEPPREIPPHLYSAFTMDGRSKVSQHYRDDRSGEDKPRVYERKTVDALLRQIGDRVCFYYAETDRWLYEAIREYGVAGKKVAIMGSQCPLYESICLFFGGRPLTIEYQRIVAEDDRLTAMTVDEYDRSPVVCDAALSISSFEHDGLGRYGDPINPAGDLCAMTKMRSVVRKGGLLFLSVPVGVDELVWNSHRVYGPTRLPILLSGWRVLRVYGAAGQPVFVLENTDGGGVELGAFLRGVTRRAAMDRLMGMPRCFLPRGTGLVTWGAQVCRSLLRLSRYAQRGGRRS